MSHLLIFGCGFSGMAIASAYRGPVFGTTRNRQNELSEAGIHPIALTDAAIADFINMAEAIVIAAPPPDPALEWAEAIAASEAWLGYLSTTAVYGDRDGGEVDETTAPAPTSRRGELRLQTERAWQEAAPRVNIFRLAGIYGSGRSPLDKIREGRSRKVAKPGQVFGRIHVEDIGRIINASIKAGHEGEIFNLVDDETCPPGEVLDFACDLLGRPHLVEEDFESADMTPMARSFYSENKRVTNAKLHTHFGELLYPNYRRGLRAIWEAEKRSQ